MENNKPVSDRVSENTCSSSKELLTPAQNSCNTKILDIQKELNAILVIENSPLCNEEKKQRKRKLEAGIKKEGKKC